MPVPPRIRWLIAALGLVAGCQCAGVPRDTCFENDCPDGGPGGGIGGGGGTAGGSGGTGGVGGGTGGAGGTGGGAAGGAGGESDGGLFCNDWPCVDAVVRSIPSLTAPQQFFVHPIPIPLEPTRCPERWRGGVLLPDGRVLAVPFCANHFLLIDPLKRTAVTVGPAVDMPGINGVFAGGVLGCDRNVYAMPHGTEDPGVVPIGPDFALDGGFALGSVAGSFSPVMAIGGAVGSCTPGPGFIISTLGPMQLLEVRPGSFPSVVVLPPGFSPMGAVRQGAVILYPGSNSGGRADVARRAGSALELLLAPGVSALGTFRGGALGASGTAHFVERGTGATWFVPPGGPTPYRRSGNADGGNFAWPAFRGDGYLYAIDAQGLLAVPENLIAANVRILEAAFKDAGVTSAEPFGGLVATPSGALVAIPGEHDAVFLFIPDGGPVLPPKVLLSPFFNKL